MSIYERFSAEELEILRARAERAARIAQQDDAEETLITALQITLGSESYALPVAGLVAVYENLTVIPVPCTPLHVAGIANIRGSITPVLDLAVLLNVPRSKAEAAPALVIVSQRDIDLALWVDGVGEIMTFAAREVNPLPTGDLFEQMAYLQGILTEGGALLNLDALLT